MEKTVLSAIGQFSLIPKGREVTVALSGGADSMSLLCVLLALKEKLDITVSAAHYNHGIRGDEADRDEQFVKLQCERLGVPLFCEKGNVPMKAKTEKIGMELAAREARYAFLERVSPDLIATAHTASDHLETVLIHLTRGSGAKGLCGIPPKRGRIIRPLIACTREDVEAYCLAHDIPFVTDSTNLSDAYTRNKLRHFVVPVLKELNPSVERTVIRAGVSFAEDEEALSSLADGYLSSHAKDGALELNGFSELPMAVKKRVLKHFVENSVEGLSLDSGHTEKMAKICLKSGRISLPRDLYAVVAGGILTLQSAKPNVRYQVETCTEEYEKFENSAKIHNLLLKNTADCDRIVGKTVIRTRKEGDRIRLAGSGCTKTLKKLYLEKRVPLSLRPFLPVIADEQGVIWIYGIGVASRCAVSKKTKRVFIIDAHEV